MYTCTAVYSNCIAVYRNCIAVYNNCIAVYNNWQLNMTEAALIGPDRGRGGADRVLADPPEASPEPIGLFNCGAASGPPRGRFSIFLDKRLRRGADQLRPDPVVGVQASSAPIGKLGKSH